MLLPASLRKHEGVGRAARATGGGGQTGFPPVEEKRHRAAEAGPAAGACQGRFCREPPGLSRGLQSEKLGNTPGDAWEGGSRYAQQVWAEPAGGLSTPEARCLPALARRSA